MDDNQSSVYVIVLFFILLLIAAIGITYNICKIIPTNLDDAIKFCGCEDKQCILLYIDGNINESEYHSLCY